MIYDYIQPTIAKAETFAAQGDSGAAYQELRSLPMADYCEVLSHVPAAFPALAKMLPTMPTDEEQRRWTGHAGRDLLVKSCSQMRLYQDCSLVLRGRGIDGPILDYGSGWGRMCRYMSYFGGPDRVYGVDPMQDSLDACAKHRVAAQVAKIDPIPESFPIEDVAFDFAFSYSVMTHTPKQVTEGILRSMRSVIRPDGLFAPTIRPIEFWEMRLNALSRETVDRMITAHRDTGYAYVPIGGGTELTEDLFGDSSYSIEYFADLAGSCGWEIAKVDRDVLEPYQITMVLRPV